MPGYSETSTKQKPSYVLLIEIVTCFDFALSVEKKRVQGFVPKLG
jgi:hypothetical protein